ncbi:MAG: succinate dehydrogenase, hydrophobic membrane anchor protein [Geminicoccaceae bacterium]|nr:succinate dehydrogenase, hydrophobic membrane anchor protein [Geminicoccaceae bacterium]
MRTAIRQVRGLGAAREGVGHWKLQRLTAIANAILILWFIVTAIGMAGEDYLAWRAWFAHPLAAAMMLLLVVSTFWHARLGVQVVIEDYVHHEGVKVAALTATTLVIFALGTVCVVSILKLAAGG